MTDQEIATRLRAEIAETRDSLAEYRQQAAPVAPDDAIGRITRMEAIGSKSVAESLVKRTEAKLAGLERALALIGTSEFGKCTTCKQEIPLARILLQPESTTCVKCAR